MEPIPEKDTMRKFEGKTVAETIVRSAIYNYAYTLNTMFTYVSKKSLHYPVSVGFTTSTMYASSY